MKSSISRLSSYLTKEEELLIEFHPQHIELTIARTDMLINGESVYITRLIDLAELSQVQYDLLKVVFEATLQQFRKGCRDLGLHPVGEWFRIPSQAEWEAAKSHKFLNQIQNHPPKEPKDEI